jgi:glutamyl/glutaminyl-tRNA synthetase
LSSSLSSSSSSSSSLSSSSDVPYVRVRFAPSPTGYLHLGGFNHAQFCQSFLC